MKQDDVAEVDVMENQFERMLVESEPVEVTCASAPAQRSVEDGLLG